MMLKRPLRAALAHAGFRSNGVPADGAAAELSL